MEVKKYNLFDQYLTSKALSKDNLSSLEIKYIQSLCPIIENKISDANKFYSQYKACRLDISSLAKELGVSRPTIYKDGIIDFIDYCKALFPGLYSSEEIKRLTKQVEEKEERLKSFRLKDYDYEELRIKYMSSDKTIAEQKKRIENLEKKIVQLQKQIEELKRGIATNEANKKEDKPKPHINVDIVNHHLKKGTKIG